MMSLGSGQLHPKIVITPSTIQQEKPVITAASTSNSEDLASNTNAPTAAEDTDVGLNKDQQSPSPTCSVENEAGIPSTTLIIPSTDTKVSM